jgi:hypothetical protein
VFRTPKQNPVSSLDLDQGAAKAQTVVFGLTRVEWLRV